MNQNDVLTTNYLAVEERFADAVNAGLFHGKQIVSPSQIEGLDTVSKFVLKNQEGTKRESVQQYRDILKAVVYDTNFCMIGVESQSEVHYVFPVRGMLYDASAYKKQWNKIKREHREKKDLKGAEFLSGFSETDALKAVVTLVVYFGTEEWNGAKDLHSLIDWTGMPEELKEIVPNYSIYLLELNKYENLDDFKSDLKTVCRFLQNSNDDVKLENMLKEYGEEFRNISEDTYDLIGTLGNMSQMKKLKDECKSEKGGFDMCKGMDDWLKRRENEGLERGRSEGIQAFIEVCEEFGASKEDTLAKVENKFSLPKAEAEAYLADYWK